MYEIKYKNPKITNFRDLVVWKEGHKLVLWIYKVTDKFPKKETFSLIDQIRRAAVSITSNVAEGFGRKGTKDKAKFYYTALGSLVEVQNQLVISNDIKYISDEVFDKIWDQTVLVQKLLNGFIKSAFRLERNT